MAPRRRAADARQLSLDLGDRFAAADDPPSRDSLFFAVKPDPAAAEGIARFAAAEAQRLGLAGSLIKTEILHVSVLGIGKYGETAPEVVALVKQAAATVDLACFTVAFDRLLSFRRRGNRPLVLCGSDGVVGLVALREALRVAMAALGLTRSGSAGFIPHMTLLYDEASVPEMLLDEPLTWAARDLVLVHSRVGKGEYEYLGKWPLRAAGA